MAKSKSNRIAGVMAASERDFQAEDDVRTLMRAREIRQDPKRLKRAQEHAKEQLAALRDAALVPDKEKAGKSSK